MRARRHIIFSLPIALLLATLLGSAFFDSATSLDVPSATAQASVAPAGAPAPPFEPPAVELQAPTRTPRPWTGMLFVPLAALASLVTPTATATATPVQAYFLPTASESIPNCGLTMLTGTIRRADGRALNGIQVRVWWEGAPADQPLSFLSGPQGYPGRPDGYWDYVLNNHPVANSWYAQVVAGATRQALSPIVRVETDEADCAANGPGHQVIRFDWVLTEGVYGSPGVTVTPTPTVTPTTTPTPVPAPDGVFRSLQVPILMYHYISDVPPGADKYRRDLSVSPADFRTQLAWLRDNGYTSISLRELADALTDGAPLPAKPVVLTFDDGYADSDTNAFPLLVEFGMRGTFFVLTDLVEERNHDYMTWEQLMAMQQAGMEIGSHTRDHPSLPGKPAAFIVSEVQGSADKIAERLGRPPVAFSYPSGRYDLGVIHLVHEAGYRVAVTTEQGMTHTSGNLLTLKRIRIHGGYHADDLARILAYWSAHD
ncbi:MAG: polysaccharide deacetylase family protein [Ardenticatenaceae bacterium]|nr:polysaccharide deacetylase family protein [Ardenticatenaceae bacterium]